MFERSTVHLFNHSMPFDVDNLIYSDMYRVTISQQVRTVSEKVMFGHLPKQGMLRVHLDRPSAMVHSSSSGLIYESVYVYVYV